MDQWTLKSHGMDLEEEFYSFDFDAGELSGYQDPAELLIALKQKEEEVILAAELGKALLLENRQLREESDKLHERYTDKLEVRRPCEPSTVCGGGLRLTNMWLCVTSLFLRKINPRYAFRVRKNSKFVPMHVSQCFRLS